MHPELTNLISIDRVKEFRREYFMRLATVALYILSIIVIVECALLLPSYLYEHEEVSARSTQLQTLSANLANTQEQQVHADIQNLQAESTYLEGADKAPTASAAIRAILAVPHTGITLSGFSLEQVSNVGSSNPGTMEISGTADTREDLRSYDAALGNIQNVSSANLPISDYAEANKIPFTITLTGSLLP